MYNPTAAHYENTVFYTVTQKQLSVVVVSLLFNTGTTVILAMSNINNYTQVLLLLNLLSG